MMEGFAGNFLAGYQGGKNALIADQEMANQNALMPLKREAMELDIAGRRQGMAIDQQRLEIARQASAREAEKFAMAVDAQELERVERETRAMNQRLIPLYEAGDPEAFNAAAAQLGAEITFDEFPVDIAADEAAFEVWDRYRKMNAGPEQPKPTAGMQEYQFAVDQGFEGTFADWKSSQRAQTNVSVNTAGQPDQYLYGSDAGLPAGWRLDRNTGEASQIPGGPAALEAESAEAKTGLVNEQTSRSGSIVLEDIGRVRNMLTGGRRQPVTGTGGAMAARVPGTEAADARALTETIKANIGFDRLQQMRDSSPTGGALGQVTERELATLQAVLGNLEFSQSKEQLIENLNRLEEVYTGILEKAAAYPNAADFGFDGTAPASAGTDDLTPEERQYLGLD